MKDLFQNLWSAELKKPQLDTQVDEIRMYIDAMGGGWLDEDKRWHPVRPPWAKDSAGQSA